MVPSQRGCFKINFDASICNGRGTEMGAISKDWVGGVIVVATDWEK